jgi:hypothetical protein
VDVANIMLLIVKCLEVSINVGRYINGFNNNKNNNFNNNNDKFLLPE